MNKTTASAHGPQGFTQPRWLPLHQALLATALAALSFGFGLAQQLGGWRVGSEGGGRKQEGEGERQEAGQAAGVHGRSSSGGRRRCGCAPRYPIDLRS